MNRSQNKSASVSAIILVAVLYVFFLLFAQFGFLQGIRAGGHETSAIHAVLAVMAFAGIGASFLVPAISDRIGLANTIAAGLFISSLAAALAGIAFSRGLSSLPLLATASSITGAGVGLATVGLAADLRRLTGAKHIALHVGAGTGLAYFFCNVPAVFQSTPSNNAWISATVALIGIVVAKLPQSPTLTETDSGNVFDRNLITTRGVALATVAFFVLVLFDSAAFAAVQISPEVRTIVWSGAARLWMVGSVHAGAAITAGILLDRGLFKTTLATAFVFLAVGSFMFGSEYTSGGAPVYAVGVSLYSTALAAFAALAPERADAVSPVWRAAWIYAIAGWAASVAGVGLAEQFGVLPDWATPLAAIVLASTFLTPFARRSAIQLN